MALRDILVYESDNWSTYIFWFALSSGVFCFCVWPSFIGAVLSVIKAHWVRTTLHWFHDLPMHDLFSNRRGHALPPDEGGTITVLCLVWSPTSPQCELQLDQADQANTLQSTGGGGLRRRRRRLQPLVGETRRRKQHNNTNTERIINSGAKH